MKWLYYPTILILSFLYNNAFEKSHSIPPDENKEILHINVTSSFRLPSGLEQNNNQKIKDDFLNNLILNYQHLKDEDASLEWAIYFDAYKKGLNDLSIEEEAHKNVVQAFVIGTIHKEILKNNENFDVNKLLVVGDDEITRRLEQKVRN